MTKQEQLLALIDHFSNGSKAQFAKMIGISPQGLSTWLSRNTFDIEVIYSKCEGISSDWLLTGTGSMLKGSATPEHRAPITVQPGENYPTRPHIPVSAAAGALDGIAQSVTDTDCELMPVIHSFPSYDFTITIDGDSMMPDYHSGDDLVCAFVTEADNINWGKPHVLDTAGGVVFKRIYNGGDSILCKSINPDYDDYEVSKDDILRIAKVVGCIRHA